MIQSEIIADSLNSRGCRLTTFICTFPRIVLAEFNTHRMFSRNSASSRAIPFNKMVKMVNENPFIPLKWIKYHTGMQGYDYWSDPQIIDELHKEWLRSRDNSVEQATRLNKMGLTKQICNRLLEPYMWHKVIVTATDWENFFSLRAHGDAEIHIQKLAYMMLDDYNKSTPKTLKKGEWHIPFGDKFDSERLSKLETDNAKVKIASARCARISYNNFHGKDDYEADIKLHDRLISSGHASPFEHCAGAMDDDNYHGNFKGFIQYRKMLADENRTDSRVNKEIIAI
jgi:thymidylate synthase ThyX